MFLIDIVIGLVEERPGSDVDDLMPDLPGYSRVQVMRVLQNCSFDKRLRCERQGVQGRRKGAKPGRYYPIEKHAAAVQHVLSANVVRCVWDLGARA